MSARNKLLLDVAVFVAYLAATDPPLTGIPVHEWLSLGLALAVIVHVALDWDWTVKVGRHFFRRLLTVSRFNFVVDVALFVAFAAVMLSGIMVSRAVLALFGLSLSFGPVWSMLHSVSAKLALPVLGLHLGLHWRWGLSVAKRMFAKPAPQPSEEAA
jgi:hypothetical protein